MSIILKKKKGILIPKSNPPTTNQILGSLGIGSVIGAATSKKEDMVKEVIEEAIERLIMEKMLVYSQRSIRSCDYFVTYHLLQGEKRIKSLFIKKRMWKNFIKLENCEMFSTGAKPEEFISYLKKKRCKSIKINREQLEKMI